MLPRILYLPVCMYIYIYICIQGDLPSMLTPFFFNNAAIQNLILGIFEYPTLSLYFRIVEIFCNIHGVYC